MIQDIKKRSNRRAKVIEGQIKALVKAIDEEQYCVDILTQSLAIQRSLGSLNKLVLENHIKTHVKQQMTSGDKHAQEKSIKELLDLYDLSNVKSR